MTPSPDLRARVLAAAKREPAASKSDVARRNLLAFAIGFAPAVVTLGFLGVKMYERPPGYVALIGAGWIALAAAATWGAIGRGNSMLGRPRAWLLAIAIAAPFALLAVAFAGYMPWPEAIHLDCDPLRDFVCFDFTSGLSLGPLVAFAIAKKDSDPVHPTLTGAALGAAAGTWGAVAMAIHCPFTSPVHVAVGHVVPVVLFATLGAIVGARVVAVRARTK